MTEPAPIGDHLRKAREALEAARPLHTQPKPRPSMDDDLDPERIAADRLAIANERREALWRQICPQRFHRATLADIDEPQRSEIEAWRKLTPRPNLVLLGAGVGVGKTHAALAAGRADAIEFGLSVRFHPVAELLDLLRPGASTEESSRWAVRMDDLVDVDRLILDDLGMERQTEWSAERVALLIDARWYEERPVIATSNLTVDELRDGLGLRSYSRLVGSDAVVLAFSGDDRRRTRRA